MLHRSRVESLAGPRQTLVPIQHQPRHTVGVSEREADCAAAAHKTGDHHGPGHGGTVHHHRGIRHEQRAVLGSHCLAKPPLIQGRTLATGLAATASQSRPTLTLAWISRAPRPPVSPHTSYATFARSDSADSSQSLLITGFGGGFQHSCGGSSHTEFSARKVHRARSDEAGAAADLWLESRRRAPPKIPPAVHSDADVRALIRDLLLPSLEVWVATEGGVLSGMIALSEEWVEQPYVPPSRQRRGHGSLPLGLVQASRGRLELWTFECNLGARGFYGADGFRQVGQPRS